MVFGDNVFLCAASSSGPDATTTTGDITSGRFQTLCGTLLYSRTDRPTAVRRIAGRRGQRAALLLVERHRARNFRDPDSPGIDALPVVGASTSSLRRRRLRRPVPQLRDPTTGIDGRRQLRQRLPRRRRRRNDLVFGQLGNDTIQGDGGIERAFAGMVDDAQHDRRTSAPRARPTAASARPASTSSATTSATSTSSPSFEAATDGEDYIEGNGGNDIVFGGLGQDDIVGGSSDFFSLDSPPTTRWPRRRRR